MRDIKFRGLRTDGKGWVYGGYKNIDGQVFIIAKQGISLDFNHEVFSESGGQFTGLHDKNVVEIYEGDIMNYGIVVFENGCFGIKDENNCFISFNDVNLCFYEVIGNIHEKP